MYILYAVAVIVVAWSLWGYFGSKVEQTQYTTTKSTDNYEIRRYDAHLVAQTTVKGSYSEALNEGFRIVAGYIFGGNTKNERIAMTTPVTEEATSEAIAMTAPVLATLEGEERTISFSMPRAYTLATLPVPTDPRVVIVSVPEKTMAVVQFSFFRTEERIQAKKDALLEALKNDGVTIIGTPYYAGYNAPFTPPWMNRHEVLVEIAVSNNI